ncbi:uncharacterized protein LOC101202933 [Cucumis sativus]|uniref:DNA polymerase delta subunit 3 n=1 Tax=Cucumis sativus TaxID=3659 RepID=A0A0A0L4K4_CUCSA|nr:uncharacterized protein LOC101202933 [Cucumis sativus]KGN55056.1 hypothetical protein Csa_012395 [Cucumis sativus]
MAEIETLGILQDIESLVADKLQVVSYKWLSRSYLISSDTAKRLLQEFVEKHESGLQVVYALSGWLKKDPPSYHIRLVSGSKLPEAKQDFDGTCSIQVYSVQASIPKDPAALWNAEFVQAEELFKQPFTADNCLRDNRFCGISNSYVKRNVDEIPASVAASQPKSAVDLESSKKMTSYQNTTVLQPQKSEMPKVSPNVGLQSSTVVKEVKSEGNRTDHQASKPIAVKEKVASLPTNKKKGQGDKTCSSTGSSLANLWGRVPTKSKLGDDHADANRATAANPTVSSAEAQICAHEALQIENSDDDEQDVNIKRSSNESGRKRRVVFDFSDDEEFEDAVSLASPENPKDQSCLDLKQHTELPKGKAHLNNDEQLNGKLKIKEEKTSELEQSLVEEKQHNCSTEKNEVCAHENDSIKVENPVDATPASPKRRKVLRTRIDDRGREVNEVVWEGEEQKQKKDDVSSAKISDQKAVETTTNRPPAAKKSPALGNGGANPAVKAGAKKPGNAAGPKQGNILSFFKRV